ncbi:MAG: M16 family metallopeptidase [Longimicrobiales bacterium]
MLSSLTLRLPLVLLAALLSSTPTHAQDLPQDPAVRTATLPNGLTYYIRENARPEARAELRLVVNAGSILESEAERGIAHFVEHMAFNGTAAFQKQALVDYLESIGMRFGPDLNAYTSFDETVYMLTVPTDSLALLRTGLDILQEWAGAIAFDSAEVVAERGVVLEEWRLGRGALARMRDAQFPILFEGSRYAERLPIGEPAVLESATAPLLRAYYERWYRPDLMAVVAVGDFAADSVERWIRERFSTLPAARSAEQRPHHDVPVQDAPRISIESDPEATSTLVSVYHKHAPEPFRSRGDFRAMLVRRVYDRMLNNRLGELTHEADPPFIGGSAAGGRLVRAADAYVLNALVASAGVLRGLEAVLREAERVRQHGFTATELEREKRAALRWMERAYAERDKTESRVYASEYVRAYLENEPFPGIAAELALYRELLPGITLAEVNALAAQRMPERGRVVLLQAPASELNALPGERELLDVFERVAAAQLDPYDDLASDAPLVDELPAAGEIIEERNIAELDLVEWRLSNNARVLLKPTDFKDDQILLQAISPGGSSLVDDDAYVDAVMAAEVIYSSGLGSFSRNELNKALAGKVADISPYIGSLEEGLSGGASPRDLETLFQLVHLHFTAPRPDSAAFMALRSRVQAMLENRDRSPESAWSDTLQVTLTQNHPRARPVDAAWFDAMDLSGSLRVYRERFADAGDFAFVLVGSFEPDSVRPLVERYIASLPANGAAEQPRDVGIDPPSGIIRKVVHRGIEAKARTQLVFTGSFDYSQDRAHALASLADVLRLRLRDVLREDLGATYGVSVSASTSLFPEPEYAFHIGFGSAPERLDELTAEVFRQIDDLEEHGPTVEELQKVKEAQRRARETALRDNQFWLAQLTASIRHDRDPRDILDHDRRVAALTTAALRDMAREYLDASNYIQVSLLPEIAN